jgi:hypothetical protein
MIRIRIRIYSPVDPDPYQNFMDPHSATLIQIYTRVLSSIFFCPIGVIALKLSFRIFSVISEKNIFSGTC